MVVSCYIQHKHNIIYQYNQILSNNIPRLERNSAVSSTPPNIRVYCTLYKEVGKVIV